MIIKKTIINKIKKSNSIEDLITLSKSYYSTIPIKIRSIIFNQVIFQRRIDYDDKYFSIKLATNLALLFMSYPFHKKFFKIFQNNKKTQEEIIVFRLFTNKFQELYISQQTIQSSFNEKSFHPTYWNYHFHYVSISLGEYLEIFKLLEKVSNKIYGFSVYEFSKLLIFLTLDVIHKPSEGTVEITNIWISNDQMKQYIHKNPSFENISKFFLKESEFESGIVYPTDIPKIFRGKIGIKIKEGYFVPQSYFIFENVLRQLIESPIADDVKGKILEKHVVEILQDFFGNESVITTYFDEDGNEQDILVSYKNYILALECKAQDFKEVFRNHTKALNRLNRRFNQIILKGCKQCDRVKENISNNNSVSYYDSDDKESRNEIIKISNTRKIEVLKIVVTLDDYLNLSESPHEFLDEKYKDTWVVNLFNLKKILWKSNKEEFVSYVKYRTSLLETIKSINSDELEQFGYFISPNFNLYPPNNLGINISLKPSFSKVFELYEAYSIEKELVKLDEYLNDISHKTH
ncbi:hypothetical protein [Bacillus safensis]|uniref:hypothetical protein n=1 Tax=Bacillus safensis TaxID=561879 RepID=UPI003CFCB30E